MITEIPTADEFHKAGLNLLYLAWGIAIEPVFDIENAEEYFGFDGDEEAKAAYWDQLQPQLANAFGLIQQAMELALKGRIAAVSPYLLISRDPKNWPSGADSKPVPFSEFHTLDAADLIKVHNAVAANPFDDVFRNLFDAIRRQRNALMHSVPKQSFEPATLVKNLLLAAEYLFNDKPWARHVLARAEESRFSLLGVSGDVERNNAMSEVDIAIRNLSPADATRFFGFDKKRRAYCCPACYGEANKDFDTWPALAQLKSKSPTENKLECVLCGEISEVERTDCANGDCKGNVFADGMCLTCLN